MQPKKSQFQAWKNAEERRFNEKIKKRSDFNMLNQFVLVGKLTEDLELKEGKENQKYAILKLAIPRSFKNADGEYSKDFIAVKIFNSIAENTAEYCKKGDVVGVKGRLESTEDYILTIIGEKVTFLSSNQNKEDK